MVNYRAFARRRGQMKAASTKVRSRDPKHSVRATRTAGRQMRSPLLDAAGRLFKERGRAAVLGPCDRRQARGEGDGPIPGRAGRRDAAPAWPAGGRGSNRRATQRRQIGKFRSRQRVQEQGETAMTALRIRARDLMTDQDLIEVRTRFTWKSVALIAHAWTLILGSIAMVAVWPNPLTFVAAVSIFCS